MSFNGVGRGTIFIIWGGICNYVWGFPFVKGFVDDILAKDKNRVMQDLSMMGYGWSVIICIIRNVVPPNTILPVILF